MIVETTSAVANNVVFRYGSPATMFVPRVRLDKKKSDNSHRAVSN